MRRSRVVEEYDRRKGLHKIRLLSRRWRVALNEKGMLSIMLDLLLYRVSGANSLAIPASLPVVPLPPLRFPVFSLLHRSGVKRRTNAVTTRKLDFQLM